MFVCVSSCYFWISLLLLRLLQLVRCFFYCSFYICSSCYHVCFYLFYLHVYFLRFFIFVCLSFVFVCFLFRCFLLVVCVVFFFLLFQSFPINVVTMLCLLCFVFCLFYIYHSSSHMFDFDCFSLSFFVFWLLSFRTSDLFFDMLELRDFKVFVSSKLQTVEHPKTCNFVTLKPRESETLTLWNL